MDRIRPAEKVDLRDVASRTPSRSTQKVLKGVIERAYDDQKSVHQKARQLRNS